MGETSHTNNGNDSMKRLKRSARRHKKRYRKIQMSVYLLIGFMIFLLWKIEAGQQNSLEPEISGAGTTEPGQSEIFDMADIPEYAGEPYVIIGDNVPDFSDVQEYEAAGTSVVFEQYSELDTLGRCGLANALLGQELMPAEERGEIGSVKPTGWHTVKYDCIEDRYLYNRCHLIGYQLSGENANEKNLITGTRYMNIEGMLPFENKVAGYIRRTGNHVRYRVTPIFQGNHLLASGVRMEAYSVEDAGSGICFDVFVYNVQPGIGIDYATGDSFME